MQTAVNDEPESKPVPATLAPHAAAAQLSYVINLMSSTSPVDLTAPDHVGLKRFSFFVSRRLEDNRERFRLHMGYFASQEDAEQLLDIVREIYPSAWAGLAPGQRQRIGSARSAGRGAETAVVPTLKPENLAAAAALIDPKPEPVRASVTPMPVASAPRPANPPTARSATPPSARPTRPFAPALELKLEKTANHSLKSVKEAIASLDDGKKAARGPVLDGPATLALLDGDTRIMPGPLPPLPDRAFAPEVLASSKAADSAAASATAREEHPFFAVQLMWSIQPIDATTVPQLAIFGAYTLYAAEGNRDGRRWYGLRLGFFTDAVSAKQVAHYVRSEFATVSVVPVTARECERAKLAAKNPVTEKAAVEAAAAAVAAAKETATPKTEFEFLDDPPVTAESTTKALTAETKPAKGRALLGNNAPGKRTKLRTQGQIVGKARAKPMTLEQTLEILGASELKVKKDERRGSNAAGATKSASAETKSKSKLGRLFEKLSERIGG